jgi:hypothetical protein
MIDYMDLGSRPIMEKQIYFREETPYGNSDMRESYSYIEQLSRVFNKLHIEEKIQIHYDPTSVVFEFDNENEHETAFAEWLVDHLPDKWDEIARNELAEKWGYKMGGEIE